MTKISNKQSSNNLNSNPNFTIENCKLTIRECVLLCEIMKGYSNKEIGKRLYLTPYTVKFHLQKLLDKTNSASRTELCTKVLLKILKKPVTPEFLMNKLN